MTSIDEFSHLIRQISSQQHQGQVHFVYGHIASYDPQLHRVRVMFPSLRDDSGTPTLSAWMPLGSIAVGNGYGVQIAPFGGANVNNPTAGEQCIVQLIERNYGVSAVCSLLFNQQSMPPDITLGPGEMLIQSFAGGILKFQVNGEVQVISPTRISLTAPEIHIGSAGETLRKVVLDSLIPLLDNHQHGGVATGSGTSGPPTDTFDSGTTTTALKAG